MKHKKVVILCIVLLILIQSIASAVGNSPEYDENTNSFTWSTSLPVALPGITIKYQTLGFKATLTHSSGNVYFIHFKPNIDKVEKSPQNENGREYETTYYSNLFSGSPTGIYEIFKSKYGSNPTAMKEITEFFATANRPLILDAVIALKKNDVLQGSMSVTNGNATFSGTLFHSANEFLNSGINWSRETREQVPKALFDIKLFFKPQPVGDPIPVIKRVDDNGNRIEAPVHEFKEGEPITIDGADSWFPSKLTPQKYIWRYNKVGESAKEVIINNPGSPLTEPLKPGEYEVRLKVSANYERPWDGSNIDIVSSTEAITIIKVVPNEEPNVTVTIHAPDKVKYGEDEFFKDIPVTLNAKVNNIELDKIKNIELRLYEKVQSKEQIYTNTISPTLNHSFNIFYDRDRLQDFEGYAILTLKNNEKIESNIARASTYIYKEELPKPNNPPVAILNLPEQSMVGNTVYMNGGQSYDPDGEVVKYEFNIPWLGFTQSGEKSYATVTFPQEATYEVILKVWDNDGNTAEDRKFIKIQPPPPILVIDTTGYLKENRKVSFNTTNLTQHLSPIVGGYSYDITPLEGQSKDNIYIKRYTNNIDTVFKEKGKYLVKVTGTNRAGATGVAYATVDIKEDLPPIADINLADIIYRDSSKMATINAYSNAYSIDGDFIGKRTWYYRFDSNNDGSFEGEEWKFVKESTNPQDILASFKVNHVGKYEVKLIVQEEFGQDTIPEFITEDDYKKAETTSIIEVDNIEPSVSFDVVNEKNIDIAIVTDYEGEDLLDVESKLNSFVRDAYEQYLNVKFDVISEKKYVGRYLHPEASGFFNVANTSGQKYKVADWASTSYISNSGGGQTYNWETGEWEGEERWYEYTPVVLTEWSDNSYEVTIKTQRATYHTYNPNETVTTVDYFPARVKKAFSDGREANFWWLENGDLYFAGTNSGNQGENWVNLNTEYILQPTKILSNVVQIEGNYQYINAHYYFLTEDGNVYAMGRGYTTSYYHTPNDFLSIQNTHPDLRTIVGATTDPYWYAYGHPYYRKGDWTGNKANRINGLSNIEYIWSYGGTLVARDKNGDWWGFGGGLNAFGLCTGFENQPRGIHSDSVTWKPHNTLLTYCYYDAVNEITYLENLSNLDKKIGGIERVEPNIVYAKNGDVYRIKETPEVIYGWQEGYYNEDGEYVNGYYADFEILGSEFTYEKIEKPIEEEIPTIYAINDNGLAKKRRFTQYQDPSLPIYTTRMRPASKGSYTNKPASNYPHISEVSFDKFPKTVYSTRDRVDEISIPSDPLAFVKPYWDYEVITLPLTWSYYGDDSYTEYSNPRIKPNLSTVQLSISPYQAGWKTYSVDVAKIQRFNFRDNSERYVIYLGKEDNFNAVNKDILDYLVENNVSVRASTKPEYVDKLVGSNEINLRQFINATPYGKLYEENKLDDILLDILKENIREDDSDGLYVIVNEDTVEYSKFYRDLEGDPKYNDKVFALHDEFYFENSMGLSDYHNKNITVSSMIFDKVGKYNIRYSAVDNPSTNNLFSNYRKESNEIDFIVYAHRRPIADFEFDLKYREKSVDIIIEDFSYDLDHESEPNKGIVKWEWFYRKNDEINWTSGKPLIANYGDYIEVYLRVTDVEGATAYAVRDILVPNEAELVLKAKARTLDGSFSITSVPASEKLELYDIWTEYPYDVSLEVAMYQGEERKTNIQRIEYSTDTGIKTENEITWNNIIHIIPATLPDGNYTLKIKAISDDGKTAELDFPVTVNTPINLVPEMPSKLITEDPTSIKGKTSKYANSLTVQLYVGHTFSTNVSLTGSQSGNIKNWIRNYTAPNTIPDGIYTARFTATTPNGNREIKDLTYKVESLKISGYLVPNPAMAGDKIYFYITTEGYADKLEIVVPNDLIAMDKRVEMGYPAVSYPSLFFNVDKNVYKKEDILDYIVWVTTEETIDKNNVRLRQPYKFIVRAYKGEMTREIELDLDIRGSILELLKPGIKNKYGN